MRIKKRVPLSWRKPKNGKDRPYKGGEERLVSKAVPGRSLKLPRKGGFRSMVAYLRNHDDIE
jgi:hypothetical protein